MSDARLRDLERRWRETSAPEDRAAYRHELRRQAPEEVLLVYRSHHEGPLSKRVVRLPGADVLQWGKK